MTKDIIPLEPEKLPPDRLDRIKSLAMQKAGIDGKAGTNMNNARNITKGKKRFIAALAAAAVILLGAVGAGAAGKLDVFGEFFSVSEGVSPFESELLSTVQTVRNDDLTLTIDGIVADEVQCKILISVYADSAGGRKIVRRLQKDPGEDDVYTMGNRQLFLEHHGYEYFEGQSYNDGSMTYPDLNNSREYHTIYEIEMSRVDLSQPFKLTEQESGLSVDFDVSPYLESYRLISEDENAFDHVVLSPMGVHIRSTQNDLDHGRVLDTFDSVPDIAVNYADGRTVKLDGVSVEAEYRSAESGEDEVSAMSDADRWKVFAEENITDQRLNAAVLEGDKPQRPGFISTDGVTSVTIDGIEYRMP